MQFTVKCPHCGARLKGVKSLMGTVVECGHCVQEFRVPAFELPGSSQKPKAEKRTRSSAAQNSGVAGRLRQFFGESRSPWLIPGTAATGAVLTLCCLVWWISSSNTSLPDGSTVDLAALVHAEDANSDTEAKSPATEATDGQATEKVDVSSDQAKSNDQPETSVNVASEKPSDATRSRAEMLQFLKDATVFIKVTTTKGIQSGSGFLVERNGSDGFVVSNSHVIEPLEGTLKTIECVFRSGRPDEFQILASIAGRDNSRDLAILKINHEKLPEPIAESSDIEVHETLSVLVLGFPFGEVLTTSKRNPAITVTRCAISSMRRDDYDQVSLLQVDGGINPGNSGGPVVTEDGHLVGVAVAKLLGTEIGFAIPRQELGNTLAGRVSKLELKEITKDSKKRIYNARPTVIDPRKNIQSAAILTFSATELEGRKPELDGSWKRVSAEATVTPLEIENGSLVIVPVELNDWAWQVKWTLNDGTVRYTEPVKYGEKPANETASADIRKAPRPRSTPPVKVTPAPTPKEKPEEPESPGTDNIVVVELPAVMADFAINPTTGDIATVDPQAHRARLFRATEAFNNVPDSDNVRLGDTPVAITYKKFGKQELYAAVCTQDSHMYVIDADSFSLVKKIPLTSAGVSNVTSSSNPEDPFIYYNYGSGHGSSAGVVDLREMVDRGVAFGDSMDCAISADGRMAYRRGPWSPSGFASLLMTNSFTDEKPIFAPLFYDHRSTGGYIPDPAGAYTICGHQVYAKGLEKLVATLGFTPSGFFRERPLIVGANAEKVFLASYNTLSSIGQSIEIPASLKGDASSLPRGVRSSADFKRVGLKVRVLPDDQYGRVLYAFRDRIALIPLAEFELPDEPFMALKPVETNLVVGKASSVEIAARDERVSVVTGALPDGATKTKTGFEWSPTNDHVGEIKVPVTLSFGEIQRVMELSFHVTQTSVRAPFAVGGAFVDQCAEQIVCWTGPAVDARGRPVSSGSSAPAVQHRIAVVSLTGEEQGEPILLTYPVSKAIIADSKVVVLPSAENARVDIFDIKTLERVKTLLATEPLIDISSVDGELMLHGQSVIDVYDLKSFARVRSVGSASGGVTSAAISGLKDGLLTRGILYDVSGDKPTLLVAPTGFLTIEGADTRLYSGSFLQRKASETTVRTNVDVRNRGAASIVDGPVSVPGRNITLSLEEARNSVQLQGSSRGSVVQFRVTLIIRDSDGTLKLRVPILNESTPAISGSETFRSKLLMVAGHAIVIVGDRIFRWPLSDDSLPTVVEKVEAVEFHIEPRQSTFLVEGSTTELKHSAKGGKAPYEFFLLTRLDGVTMDDKTGVTTITTEKLMKEVAATIRKAGVETSDAGAAVQKLKSQALDVMKSTVTLVGRKVSGVPVAVPIHFKAIDEDGNVAEMQYFVLIEISYPALTDMLRQNAVQPGNN